MRKPMTPALPHLLASVLLVGATAPAFAQQPSSGAGEPPAAATLTGGQRVFGDVVPKMAELTDNVLFGDVWERKDLSPRDRSLVTISALIAMNRPDQFKSHLRRALDNGVTREEVAEVITHLAFYAGWPSAVDAAGVAREVFTEE